jgi:hypothetical protein
MASSCSVVPRALLQADEAREGRGKCESKSLKGTAGTLRTSKHQNIKTHRTSVPRRSLKIQSWPPCRHSRLALSQQPLLPSAVLLVAGCAWWSSLGLARSEQMPGGKRARSPPPPHDSANGGGTPSPDFNAMSPNELLGFLALRAPCFFAELEDHKLTLREQVVFGKQRPARWPVALRAIVPELVEVGMCDENRDLRA